MKLLHLIRKMLFRFRVEGFSATLKELVYFNRIMVGVEKEIVVGSSLVAGSMRAVIADKTNYRDYQASYNITSLSHFCPRGCECLMLIDGDRCAGYQFWTFSNEFVDLKKLNIQMNIGEAYLFDLFVFPEFRGTNIPRIISAEMQNHLASKGVHKVYGFYFQDNLKALWWHRAFFKCREIRKVPSHRIFFLDMTRGKIRLNI